jgi:hypothetical protein
MNELHGCSYCTGSLKGTQKGGRDIVFKEVEVRVEISCMREGVRGTP